MSGKMAHTVEDTSVHNRYGRDEVSLSFSGKTLLLPTIDAMLQARHREITGKLAPPHSPTYLCMALRQKGNRRPPEKSWTKRIATRTLPLVARHKPRRAPALQSACVWCEERRLMTEHRAAVREPYTLPTISLTCNFNLSCVHQSHGFVG